MFQDIHTIRKHDPVHTHTPSCRVVNSIAAAQAPGDPCLDMTLSF